MIKSMTGYGKAAALLGAGTLTVEIRSLNSKSADITVKSQLLPRDREIQVRKMLADALVRGTIDVYLGFETSPDSSPHAINADVFHAYWRSAVNALDAETILTKTMLKDPGVGTLLANAILRMPDVVEVKKADAIAPEEWPLVEKAFADAIAQLDAYRSREGEALYRDVTGRVARILDLYAQVEALEGERIETVKARIRKNLEDLAQKPDPSRFEQELIFYLEKFDINEEKVRLRQHCKYFMETIDGEPCPGKKLGFIIQEMGREINTTGSKANHAGIQRLVVQMKDELEKIREQSMNIL